MASQIPNDTRYGAGYGDVVGVMPPNSGYVGPGPGVGGGGEPPPLDPYPGDAPDFRDPAQNPNPAYYDPNQRLDQFGYQTGIDGESNYDVNVGMTGGLMDTVSLLAESPYGDRNYVITPGRAATRGVQQEELSQYQLQQMLASDSPLMRQAGAQGLARGGARGLMNSSLATGAAQGAMIAGAQPFALQDAGWYGETAADNMAARNRMAEANLAARTSSMEAGARRDLSMIGELATGYGDIRKAMIDLERREDEQGWRTGEREGTQDWQAAQDELNRQWTSDENMMTNSLAWAQTKLDAATKMGISRGQALADMATAIWSNPDKKFSKTERENAIRMIQREIDVWYPGQEADAYERSYDPATGTYDESLRPAPPDDAGAPIDRGGSVVVRPREDGTYDLRVPDYYSWSRDFNSLP